MKVYILQRLMRLSSTLNPGHLKYKGKDMLGVRYWEIYSGKDEIHNFVGMIWKDEIIL